MDARAAAMAARLLAVAVLIAQGDVDDMASGLGCNALTHVQRQKLFDGLDDSCLKWILLLALLVMIMIVLQLMTLACVLIKPKTTVLRVGMVDQWTSTCCTKVDAKSQAPCTDRRH